ncbi:TPA: hypothetical protein I8Z16_001726 [Legionella pneumophila]|nr:hypothetical protein [Legionella pneumophila]
MMNDFTKEELNEIRVALVVYGLGECGSILYSKIQSLIDNYCEHEEKETIQTSFAKSVFENRCKKCRRYV